MAGSESSDTPWLSLFQVAYDPYSGYISLGAYFKTYEIATTTRLAVLAELSRAKRAAEHHG